MYRIIGVSKHQRIDSRLVLQRPVEVAEPSRLTGTRSAAWSSALAGLLANLAKVFSDPDGEFGLR